LLLPRKNPKLNERFKGTKAFEGWQGKAKIKMENRKKRCFSSGTLNESK